VAQIAWQYSEDSCYRTEGESAPSSALLATVQNASDQIQTDLASAPAVESGITSSGLKAPYPTRRVRRRAATS